MSGLSGSVTYLPRFLGSMTQPPAFLSLMACLPGFIWKFSKINEKGPPFNILAK